MTKRRKGSPMVSVRVPQPILDQVLAAIARSQHTRHIEGYCVSTWLLAAIEEKLAHLERSRKPRPRRRPASEAASLAAQVGETPAAAEAVI